MSNHQTKYELLEEDHNTFISNNFTWCRLCILISLCIASSLLVFTTWNAIYRQTINIPPNLIDVPIWWYQRADIYAEYTRYYSNNPEKLHQNSTSKISLINLESNNLNDNNESIYLPTKYDNYKYNTNIERKKLICYYIVYGNKTNNFNYLELKNIDPYLCTHINIGMVNIVDNRLHITENLKRTFLDMKNLRQKNQNLKILISIGGANAGGFTEMVINHASRKMFIQSIKSVLKTYLLNGIDLDWEFPSAYNKERQHFSQLLYEIRREYGREHRPYLLSVAVAAPEGIAFFAYDIREIQNYCDYVNIMTYDFHFYSSGTPFTGINAPLYPRYSEQSILRTLNINYTAHYWNFNGLDKNKIIIGLPTYGHTFRLVNPFNNGIDSPAENIGSVGELGFVSYSEICWFIKNNIYVTHVFDEASCSPYLHSGLEWISYDNEESLECKTKYIMDNEFGGAMIFSLNTDDFGLYCKTIKKPLKNKNKLRNHNGSEAFPLIRKIHSILFAKF